MFLEKGKGGEKEKTENLGNNYYEKFSVFSIFSPFPFSKNIFHYGFHDVQVQL